MDKNETPSGRKLRAFEDIVVTGLDDQKISRPDKNKLLYDVYFQLSTSPPPEWIKIFNNERRFPRHSMWRDARVIGQAVVIRCGLDEVEPHHLADIRQDVATSNRKYREYLELRAREEQEESIAAEQERKSIEHLKNLLKF